MWLTWPAACRAAKKPRRIHCLTIMLDGRSVEPAGRLRETVRKEAIMADDLTKRGSPGRDRINLNED
jgi:hypothetical protein